MSLTVQEKKDIKKQGFSRTGGIPRTMYYTPDGREIEAIPSWRGYHRKDKEGNVIGSGTRDANLDKGWALVPPKDPLPYCAGCDKWHDTQEEVTVCIAKKEERVKKWEEYAKKERAEEEETQRKETEELRTEVLELKGMIYELTQALKSEG
ncbi:hypothetical protein CMI37_31845 [Candidatus Pacearchaeota archaeon]|nr:hypothetical protein [Candidatus Pacearchaeota archaeon]|tara:strand:- start:803 stop:1255 length:453 start_codon:yes stop_codon:yes gene_type:complete